MLYVQDLFILGPAICLLTDPVIFGNFFLELRGRCGQTVTYWASKRVSQLRLKIPGLYHQVLELSLFIHRDASNLDLRVENDPGQILQSLMSLEYAQ